MADSPAKRMREAKKRRKREIKAERKRLRQEAKAGGGETPAPVLGEEPGLSALTPESPSPSP